MTPGVSPGGTRRVGKGTLNTAQENDFMGHGLESLIEEWDGLGVVVSHHRETGSWIFIALHDATLGRPTGGCRLRTYRSPADGLRDAMRLAEGMTWKWAAMDFRYGGGKSVLAVPGPVAGEARRSLFTRLGHLMNALNGGYGVGEDLGTTPGDMAFLATVTPYVAGIREDGSAPDPGPFTAVGVFAGIEAAVAHLDGGASLAGKSVLIEGVGDVGEPLARLLGEAGAKVIAADLDEDRARRVAGECGGTVIDCRDVQDTECDVYAPCAVGATVSARTVPLLRCRIVAGSANNQLEVAEDADRLLERGILYAPDYVINGGGAMAFGLMAKGILDTDRLNARVRSIGGSLAAIFREADAGGESPVVAARKRARRVLRRAGG
ncbi:MAG: amino acid dehydrogenase [Gemmatimonadetes bacterium]|nr:amino acid dehydrogenase [Gemmatimonadota bacterium]MYH54338.1 amino acid dehydrogenase [Gemmatimonadota bacterium]MYK64979.1 amino acid dehydrogenase [Gemmatimonadota bacterium]